MKEHELNTNISFFKEPFKKRKHSDKRPRKCTDCGVETSPEWRHGPDNCDLRNACGISYQKEQRKQKKLAEQNVDVDVNPRHPSRPLENPVRTNSYQYQPRTYSPQVMYDQPQLNFGQFTYYYPRMFYSSAPVRLPVARLPTLEPLPPNARAQPEYVDINLNIIRRK